MVFALAAQPPAPNGPVPVAGRRSHDHWLLSPAPRQWVIVGSAVGQVAYAVSILVRHGKHDGFFWDGVGAAAALLGVLAIVRRRRTPGFGIAAAASAFVILNVLVSAPAIWFDGHGPLTAALVWQLLWLTPYVAFSAHLVLLARSRLGRTPRTVWLDTLIFGGATASLVGGTVLAPLLREGTRYWFGGFVCAIDLLLLGLILGVLAATGWARDSQLLLVLIGGAAFAISDVWAMVLGFRGTWALSSYSVAVLMVASLTIQSSCWLEPRAVRLTPSKSSRALVLPIGGALLATSVLGAAAFSTSRPASASMLALGALSLSLVRWGADARAAGESQLHQRLSQIDDLTGISNRRGFYLQVDTWCAGTHERCGLAALLIDLDDFKQINDAAGHHAGDAVLIAVAERLARAVPAEAAVGRLGGDEFAVCVPLPNSTSTAELACAIATALSEPVPVPGSSDVRPGASIGGVWSRHPVEREVLLRAADRNMYRAKTENCGTRVSVLEGEADSGSVRPGRPHKLTG